jgi:hypothetical protein
MLSARRSRKRITVQFTIEELEVLIGLADSQLFRAKYIDPKMPGYRPDPARMQAGQSALSLLQDALKKEKASNGERVVKAVADGKQ